MKQNNKPKFPLKQTQKSWSINTTQRIHKLSQKLAQVENPTERQELENACQVQWDYLERIEKAVNQRQIYQPFSRIERENKWEELRMRLTTWENQAEDEREQVGYDLFALLDRSQIQDQVVAKLGKLGTILNPKALSNLKSFSEGGWYDIVVWFVESLDPYKAPRVTEFISDELVHSALTSLLYEINGLVSTTAQELDCELNF